MFNRASNNCDYAKIADDAETLESFMNGIGTDKRVIATNNSVSVAKNKLN
jgi:hypothetical protein